MEKHETERIITPMPKTLVAAIDEFRYENRVPSRSEAIRQLLLDALERAKPKQRKK